MIEPIGENNISAAAEAFSASWRFSHNGIVSGDVIEQHSPEFMRGVIAAEEKKGNSVYTYFEGGESLGIISFNVEECHISKLYVNAAHLRQGIGRSLLTFAVSKMPEGKSVSVISLNINFRARAFYESLGFKFSGTVYPFDGRGDVLQMLYVLEREESKRL